MNKFITLFLSLFVFLAIQNNFAIAREATENFFLNQKKVKIKHVYAFSGDKGFKKKHSAVLYVLEDGFTIYKILNSKKKCWQKGDKLIIKFPLSDLDDSDEFFIHVKNKNKKEKEDSHFMAMGWAAPHPLKIISIDFEKVEGDKIITLTLSDDTQWKITYFDETAYAKKWKVGEKVLLFIEPSIEDMAFNPFLTGDYSTEYIYGIFNFDSVNHFAGSPAYPSF